MFQPGSPFFNNVGRMRWTVFCVLVLSAGGGIAPGAENQPDPDAPPHIVFFLTDDMRYDAMGCAGNPVVRTPHIDQLASEGMLFRNSFVTTSICMTSRASILTGQYERRHGISDFNMPLGEEAFAQTYPALLRKAGYYTGFVGKWGLGGALPKEQFDYFTGYTGQGRYFEEGDPEHLTRKLTRQALAFLEEAPADRPLLLCISYKAPHCQDRAERQFPPDPAYETLYRDATIPVPASATPDAFASLPEFLQRSEGRTRWERRFATPEMYQATVKDYYRLVTGVDVSVGTILDRLKQAGLDARTVVIFTSDNGFFLGEHGLAGKWFMYEESIRVPLIVRDPRVPAAARGRQVDAMALNIDVAPTILALAGLDAPDAMQGRSLASWLRGGSPDWRKEFFYEHTFDFRDRIPPCEGVRTTRYKYIRYVNADPVHESLFDLEQDPHELNNLAGDPALSAVLDELRESWRQWRRKVQ